MRDEEEATDGPADPILDPTESPGFGVDPAGLEDIEVSREGVTIGDATPEELAASDVSPTLGDETAALLERLLDGEHVERRRSALALADRLSEGRIDDGERETVLRALSSAATTDTDDDVRQFAVEALGKSAGGEIAVAAAKRCCEDPDPWVRSEAVVALDRLDREAHAATIRAALDEDHHGPRRNAAISVFKREGEEAGELLLDLTRDESERVREWAAHLLSGVGGEDVAERLRELAAEDDSEIVQSTAARALEADPGAFRRQFTGALDESERTLPGEDHLNRQPDL